MNDTDEITPAELDALLDTDEPVRVVDVRSPTAFERGHIPESENVPFDAVPRRAAEFADTERVVTVCPEGKASLQAMQLLRSSRAVDGRIESLAGGLAAWHDEGRTLETTATADESSPAGEASDPPF